MMALAAFLFIVGVFFSGECAGSGKHRRNSYREAGCSFASIQPPIYNSTEHNFISLRPWFCPNLVCLGRVLDCKNCFYCERERSVVHRTFWQPIFIDDTDFTCDNLGRDFSDILKHKADPPIIFYSDFVVFRAPGNDNGFKNNPWSTFLFGYRSRMFNSIFGGLSAPLRSPDRFSCIYQSSNYCPNSNNASDKLIKSPFGLFLGRFCGAPFLAILGVLAGLGGTAQWLVLTGNDYGRWRFWVGISVYVLAGFVGFCVGSAYYQ